MRQLASVQRIVGIAEIPGADNIELAFILGWQCVVEKGVFKVGDLCIYFEIDSQLPVHEVFFFMEPRKYRVRTIKKMKNLSQGLAMSLNITQKMGHSRYLSEGDDVTEMLGVTKYEPRPDNVDPEPVRKHNKLVKFMMKFSWFRTIYWFIYPKRTKGNFPEFITKTDEERLQSCPSILHRHKDTVFYATEKLDGSSATYFYNKALDKKRFGIIPIDKGNGFGVCSRNLRLIHDDNRCWWYIANVYNMEEKIREASSVFNKSLAFQGEIVGPAIQKNKYNLKEWQFFCFSVFDIDTGKYLPYHTKVNICKMVGIPVLEHLDTFTLDGKDVNWFVEYATRYSFLNAKTLAEGTVIRALEDDNVSFKVISPKFLLKNEE